MPTEGYGGIWLTGKPFQVNVKCIVIGIMAAGIYMLPRFTVAGNIFMMAFIFVITYILISLYDYMYKCDAHMFSRGISPSAIFKPQYRGAAAEPPPGEEYDANQDKAYLRSVYWAHSAIIAPIFLYGSYEAMRREKKRGGNNYSVWPVTFGIAMLAAFYHVIRIFYPRDVCV